MKPWEIEKTNPFSLLKASEKITISRIYSKVMTFPHLFKHKFILYPKYTSHENPSDRWFWNRKNHNWNTFSKTSEPSKSYAEKNFSGLSLSLHIHNCLTISCSPNASRKCKTRKPENKTLLKRQKPFLVKPKLKKFFSSPFCI